LALFIPLPFDGQSNPKVETSFASTVHHHEGVVRTILYQNIVQLFFLIASLIATSNEKNHLVVKVIFASFFEKIFFQNAKNIEFIQLRNISHSKNVK